MLKTWLLVLTIFLIAGCKGAKTVEYSYFDGSGNQYRLTLDPLVLEYNPIQPLESSSGEYSGGEAYRYVLTSEQLDALKNAIDIAVSDTIHHISNRVMMSGMIRIKNEHSSEVYILSPGAPSKARIEELLHSYKP